MENNTTQTSIAPNKSPKIVHASIIVAIVIVMNLLFNYAASLIFKEPVFDIYVKPAQIASSITTKESCIKIGGQWSENAYPTDKGKTEVLGSCDPDYTNRLKYEEDNRIYNKKVFIALISLGIISLITAGFIAVQILSIAFAWGGVLSLIIASIRYWSYADSLAKVIILALALGILIWLAIKKFNK